jgi:hypothetical protein
VRSKGSRDEHACRDDRRLEETGAELAALLQEDKLASIPFLTLANNQDLATAAQTDQITIGLRLH